jgi:hypothetical protein
MTVHGYSDRINHALAFAAKYYGTVDRPGMTMAYLAHPANIAIILARYGCDDVTIVAGILHRVLEETPPDPASAQASVGNSAPSYWRPPARSSSRADPLRRGARGERAQFSSSSPSRTARSTSAADEITPAVRPFGRGALGRNYSPDRRDGGSVWSFRAVTEHLTGRPEWPRKEMLRELQLLNAELRAVLDGG